MEEPKAAAPIAEADCMEAARQACFNGCRLSPAKAMCRRCSDAGRLAWQKVQEDRQMRYAEPEAIDPASCQHLLIGAQVNVQRLEDLGRFIAEITVWCASCKTPFSFTGLPLAISCDRATLNIDATQLSLPVEPGAKPIPLGGTIPIEMPRKKES